MPTDVKVPVVAPVQLGDRQFIVDYTKLRHGYLHRQRPSVDSSPTPGEGSLNPEGSVPRSQTDWSLGGAQEVFDDEPADPRRYHTGRNVQVVRRGRIQLSNKLQQLSTTRGLFFYYGLWTERQFVQTGNSLFWIEFSSPNYTLYRQSITSGPYGGAVTPTAAIGSTTTAMTCLATDGTNYTWVARGGSGVSRATTEAGSFTAAWSSLATNNLVYANGHLLGIAGGGVWEFDSAGAKLGGADIFSHPNVSWIWQGGVAGAGLIYLWGNAGNDSAVYVLSDILQGGTLAPPRIALPMPPGEVVTHMEPIGGAFLVRTNLGLRVVEPDGDILNAGRLIVHRERQTDIPNTPVCVSATTDAVFIGWRNSTTNPDFISRLDLSAFAGEVPAHHLAEYTPPDGTAANNCVSAIKVANRTDTVGASNDLWVLGGTNTGSVRRIWATTINQAPNTLPTAREKASSGTWETGWLTWGLTEPKQPLTVRVITDPMPSGASILVEMILSSGGAVTIGTCDSTGSPSAFDFTLNPATFDPAREFALRFTLNRATTNTSTPVMRHWSARAYIIPTRQVEVWLPVMLYDSVVDERGRKLEQNPMEDYAYLQALVVSGTPVTLKEGGAAAGGELGVPGGGLHSTVIVDDVRLDGLDSDVKGLSGQNHDARFYQGTYFVRCLGAV